LSESANATVFYRPMRMQRWRVMLSTIRTMPMMAIVADGSSMCVDRHARPGAAFSCAAIVHVGQSAVVLRPVSGTHGAADGLLVVTGESAGLMPGGIRMPNAQFSALLPRFAALRTSNTLVDATTFAHSAMEIDLHIRPSKTYRAALDALQRGLWAETCANGTNAAGTHYTAAVMNPDPLRRQAPLLAEAATDGAMAQVRRQVGSLIGAGPGTTPTGDDIIVGVLAACALVDDRRAGALVATAVAPLLADTTAASQHYLRAAIDGRFGEHIHELVSAATARSSPAEAIARAKTWGSSSGLDVLTGLLAMLKAAQPNTERMDDLSMERSA
jgi:hypothetical protein